MTSSSKPSGGFTLLEVLLAISITSMALIAVTQTFIATLRARNEVDNLSESTDAGLRILALIERDLSALWTYNVRNNAVFRGRDWRGQSGRDADKIDFLTSADSIGGTLDNQSMVVHPSVCEVGYWLKSNPSTDGDLMELWRREDPLIDDLLIEGGTFQLVSDRVKSFNVTYYETLGAKAEPIDDWDSSLEDKLPRRIQVEFVIERKGENANELSGAEVSALGKQEQKYVRHIVLDPRYNEILQAGVAMIPVAPGRPEAGGGPIGPAGPGGGDGPKGPAGGGGARPDTTITQGGFTQQRGGGGNTPRGGGGRGGGGRGGGGLGGLFGTGGGGEGLSGLFGGGSTGGGRARPGGSGGATGR